MHRTAVDTRGGSDLTVMHSAGRKFNLRETRGTKFYSAAELSVQV